MGKDSDIVTLTFIVNSKLAGDDLVGWLERGYDFVLDASLSDGEIEPGKYLVFAEMNRRTSVPERIINILEDLETLTDIKLKDWSISIEDEGDFKIRMYRSAPLRGSQCQTRTCDVFHSSVTGP